jgi:hypothetical protein
VTVAPVTGNSALDTQPDARQNPPGAQNGPAQDQQQTQQAPAAKKNRKK